MSKNKKKVKKKQKSLRFNLGFLLEAGMGASRDYEIDYPLVFLEDDLVLSPLKGSFKMVRNSKGVYVSGVLHSQIETECARCLDNLALTIDIPLDDLFYYPPQTTPEGEFPMGEDGFIDMAPLVRQLSLLELPIQPFCRPDCQGLCPECGQNLNEGSCDCVIDDIDPRLASLRALLDDQPTTD